MCVCVHFVHPHISVHCQILCSWLYVNTALRVWAESDRWHLPDVACVAADQLNDPARVADGSVCEQKEQTGMSAEHRLPQDPVERCQDVGAPHVGSNLPDILTRQCQGFLNKRMMTIWDVLFSAPTLKTFKFTKCMFHHHCLWIMHHVMFQLWNFSQAGQMKKNDQRGRITLDS